MRRIACGLAVAALGALAGAGPAGADTTLSDKCGTNDLSLPALVDRDVTAPWLDLCAGDVKGVAGKGTLRAVQATLTLAGDTADRSGSAAYSVAFDAGPCTATLHYEDLGPGASSGQYGISGQCNAKTAPCEPQITGQACFTTTGGTPCDRTLPVADAKLSGSTVTLFFDPNALPRVSPQPLLDGFRAG